VDKNGRVSGSAPVPGSLSTLQRKTKWGKFNAAID